MKQSAFDSSQINFTPKENQTDSKPSAPKTMTNKAPDSNIFTCGENKKNIESVLSKILSSGQKFEAFVCATDIIAFHTINYLKSRSIRVPDDIAVTGFNNYDIAEICAPSITTVSMDMREIGRTIARMMLDEIAGIEHRNVTLCPFQLIVRESA